MSATKHLFLILLLFAAGFTGRAQFRVQYVGPDSQIVHHTLGLLSNFPATFDANAYVARLPVILQSKGYITASIDSFFFDTASARVHLFLGEQYKWAHIRWQHEHDALFRSARWPKGAFQNEPVDFTTLETRQKMMLNHFEEEGYPFAKIYLDSIQVEGASVYALMKVEQGPLYHIDSIRVYGNAKLSNDFLQRYLEIPNGSIYNKHKLDRISRKLAELTYIVEERPSDLTLLGTGSVLNLYLKQRKSSQINALVGFLPNSNAAEGKKFLLTVDANILLRNALGGSETIGLIWQQLQQKSPRLNLLFDQPYVFKSRFGANFIFDMYKKDDAFLNINMHAGTTYRLEEQKTVSFFLQRRSSIVTPDTAAIIQNRKLPQDADVSSTNLGSGYQYLSTDYRLNPRKGTEFTMTVSAGNKKIRKNSKVLSLKDPFDPSYKFDRLYDTIKLSAYQVRITAGAARYFALGGQHVLKLGGQAGVYQSANYFRNELFQIGGYKLLRGFDEESQFVSQYGVGTLEYRYLIGINSNFFAFIDGGWGNHRLEEKATHTYLSGGAGLSFETRAGIFNLTWALGKRDDTDFNLRQSKLHLGFVNYF